MSGEPPMQRGARVRSEDVKRRSLNLMVDRPFHGALEHRTESCQTERRKQRVFDRTPERALRFGECGQNLRAVELGQEHALPVPVKVAVDSR